MSPDLTEALEMTGCRDVADLQDMAIVGRSLLDAIAQVVEHGPLKGWMPADGPAEIVTDLANELDEARAEIERLRGLIGAPELRDFARGVVLEAAHQRERWASEHDAGKAPEDWFWLLGFLVGKALHAAKSGDADKALHHTISSGAALANWHAALLGVDSQMRPGIATPPGEARS